MIVCTHHRVQLYCRDHEGLQFFAQKMTRNQYLFIIIYLLISKTLRGNTLMYSYSDIY